MKELFKAIHAESSGSTGAGSLYAALTGGMYLLEAPQDTNYPYAVLYPISNIPHWTFDSGMENALVQFTIYASSSGGAEPVCDLYDKLITLYDFCNLTIDNYDSIYMKREFSNLDKSEGIFTYHCQYRVELQEST